MMNYTSCALVYELLQSHYGDNQESTLSSKDFERIFNNKINNCMISLCTLSFHRLMYSPCKAVLQIPKLILMTYVVVYAIWYHPYNIKNVKNTDGGLLLLVKLQASACSFTKSNTPPWVFLTFFKLCTWY